MGSCAATIPYEKINTKLRTPTFKNCFTYNQDDNTYIIDSQHYLFTDETQIIQTYISNIEHQKNGLFMIVSDDIIDTILSFYGEMYQWAVYIPKISKKTKLNFKRHQRGTDIPNGYWQCLQNKYFTKKTIPFKSIRLQLISTYHLNLIYSLLDYYSCLSKQKHITDNNSPLICYLNTDKVQKFDDNYVNIKIDECVYNLRYWNKVYSNKEYFHKPTAISIINMSAREELRNNKHLNEPIEICYMRYDSDLSRIDWRWYNNDFSSYTEFDKSNINLYNQLELSFQANLCWNFHPQLFEYKFNNCLLSELNEYLKRNYTDFTFVVTFSSAYQILNMEQVSYNHEKQRHFPRSIVRLIDGNNIY